MRHRRRWRAPIAALLVASGCGNPTEEPAASADLATGNIALYLLARSNGDVAQFVANVGEGDSGNSVILSSGDALLMAGPGGVEQTMAALATGFADQVPVGGTGAFESGYVGQLPTGGTGFQLVLQRAGARVSSPITLPPAFTLAGPAGTASRSAPIQLQWDAAPAPTTTSVAVFASCLTAPITRDLSPDPGALSLQPGNLFVAQPAQECDVTVEVTHTEAATLASDLYAKSSASLVQIRTITVATGP